MDKIKDFINSDVLKNLGVYGIHIYKEGNVIINQRYRSNDRENLYSGSKTFAAIGIGIAIDEKLIQLHDKVLDYFPEYQDIASEGSDLMEIEHLLHMASGHVEEDFSRYNKLDRGLLFFSTVVRNKPGMSFFYEDLCTYMLGRIIEKVSGKTLLDYLKPRLFDYLDIVNPQWHSCPNGHTVGSSGLYLTTEEYARIGILMLNHGIYNNHKVVSASFILKMKNCIMDSSNRYSLESQLGYGYHVWKCSVVNSYRADGMYGQICIILEDDQTVITYTGHNEYDGKAALGEIYQNILPYLKERIC
ncbi:MAG: serine hydrolase [Clostridia bacterium]|nr:serine hydrolase [Clostridia bacterium]